MISEQAQLWLRLSLLRGVGPMLGRRLVEAMGGIAALWSASPDALAAVDGVGPQLVKLIVESRTDEAAAIATDCTAAQIGILCPDDDHWPSRLIPFEDAPLLLFYRGDAAALNSERMLAVVGARRASREGDLITRRWCQYFSQRAITIVSGMAYGIDAAAHGGTLQGDSPTVAVLGCGLMSLSEQQQRQVAAIARQGCVVSELLPETAAKPEFFPRRNRIIAGLSDATLVMEADVRSGSLITAKQAAGYGREVCAVPGSVLGNHHAGCHQLIREGATLIESADQLLEQLGWQAAQDSAASAESRYQTDDKQEQQLLDLLTAGAMHLDHLAEGCGLTVPELSPILLRLELQGAIERLPGSRYILTT